MSQCAKIASWLLWTGFSWAFSHSSSNQCWSKEKEVDPFTLPRSLTNVLSAWRKCYRRILPVQFTGLPECLATGERQWGKARCSLSERLSFHSTWNGLWEVLSFSEQQKEPGLFSVFPLFIFIPAQLWEEGIIRWQELLRMSWWKLQFFMEWPAGLNWEFIFILSLGVIQGIHLFVKWHWYNSRLKSFSGLYKIRWIISFLRAACLHARCEWASNRNH